MESKIWVKSSARDFFEGCRQRRQVKRDSRGKNRHRGVHCLSTDTHFLKAKSKFGKKIAQKKSINRMVNINQNEK